MPVISPTIPSTIPSTPSSMSSSMSSLPRIKFLLEPTSDAWIEQTLANMETILLDHAHCERKAASVALKLMARYPSHTKLVHELTHLAQEELLHFHQVNSILADRNIPLAPLNAPPYGATLTQVVRRPEPDRFLDSLLVSALIEARSHERLGLIGQHCEDQELAEFYRSLMESEARHYGLYWILADTYFDRSVVMDRLEAIAVVESEILSTLHPEPRIHS
jgi:tRNA 2-(methylsulfanyl)-N6-isopentenyladenosine37 hydroxylase